MTPAIDLLATGFHRARLTRALSAAAGAARRGHFQVLTYHRVNDDRDPFFPSVPTEVFERHMAWVARTQCVLTVEDLVERSRHGDLPRNAVAITFDDGYRDNLTHAAPVLARHGLPATIFLATGFVGTAEVPWFDRVALALKTTRATRLEAPWGAVCPLATPADRLAALDGALAGLKRLPDEAMRRSVEALLEALDVTDPSPFRNLMLGWDDVHALAGLGFSIGAHTVTHPILSRMSEDRARAEIEGSRSMIETACGRPPRAFAYPNGGPEDYTAVTRRLVRDAGFACALTTRFGVNTSATDLYELRRGGPWEHDLPTFALKLAAYRLRGG